MLNISQSLGLFTCTDCKACLSMYVACSAFLSSAAFSLAPVLLTMQYDHRQ